MLDFVSNHIEEFTNVYQSIKNNEKYKYAYIHNYQDTFIFSKDTSNVKNHEFVSIFNNKILGYIYFETKENYDIVEQLSIVSICENSSLSTIFMKDLYTLIRNLFIKKKTKEIKFNIHKNNINWLKQIERLKERSTKIKIIQFLERDNYIFYKITNMFKI